MLVCNEMEEGLWRRETRRNDVGGKEAGTSGGDCMEKKRTEEPTKRMETPNKAPRRWKEDDAGMDAGVWSSQSNGIHSEAWIPIFGAAKAMDYMAIANLAVTSREMERVCKDEILMRKECESEHIGNASFFQTRVEKAHQKIRYPYAVGEYGSIRKGGWFDDLIGFDFGPRPADMTEYIDGAQYTEAHNGKVALSRTIITTRCLNCGYLYAMSATGGKVHAMRHGMMDIACRNFHRDGKDLRPNGRTARAARREAIVRDYEAIMERIATHPQE